MSLDARTRIVDAMVLTVGERGFTHTTVTEVCGRAQVSRGTFYETFDGREDCFLAVIDEGYRQAEQLMSRAFAQASCWREGVRTALAELLRFFDAEPQLARVWLVESLGAGGWALERRERHIASLIELILERWRPPPGAQRHALGTLGVMTSVLGVIQSHLVTARPEPLLTLLGPLMGMITTPYLPPHAVAAEIEYSQALAEDMLSRDALERRPAAAVAVTVPDALRDPRAHRARQCLLCLSECAGASNRRVATAIGVVSHTQISTLLGRLADMGLLHKHAGRPGYPNAWWLTPYGQQIVNSLNDEQSRALDGHTSHIP